MQADELAALHPTQFAPRPVSFRWPKGWHAIVADVCDFAAKDFPDLRWIEIKEKLGALRMVHLLHRDASLINEKIDEAWRLSARTCALCGTSVSVAEAGADVGLKCISGWWIAACNDCAPIILASRSVDLD